MTSLPTTDRPTERIGGMCLLAAPVLMAISSILWYNDATLLGAGIVQTYACILYIPAILSLARLLQLRAPRLALGGGLVGIFGCVGGVNYGTFGVYQWAESSAGASEATRQAVAALADVQLWPILNLPGVSFPLALLIISVGFFRTGIAPRWLAIMLGCGAMLFPMGRIPDIQVFQHLADILIFIPFAWLGLRILTEAAPRRAAVPVAA